MNAPILAFPDFCKPFRILTDASKRAIGGVLLQHHGLEEIKGLQINFAQEYACIPKRPGTGQKEGIWRPVMFFGRKLSKTEKHYTTTERELLALVEGYKYCYHYVFGRHIEPATDHEPLVKLVDLKNPFGRLGRLLQQLAGVDFSFTYIPGEESYLADFMSRCVLLEPLTETIQSEVNGLELNFTIDCG